MKLLLAVKQLQAPKVNVSLLVCHPTGFSFSIPGGWLDIAVYTSTGNDIHYSHANTQATSIVTRNLNYQCQVHVELPQGRGNLSNFCRAGHSLGIMPLPKGIVIGIVLVM